MLFNFPIDMEFLKRFKAENKEDDADYSLLQCAAYEADPNDPAKVATARETFGMLLTYYETKSDEKKQPILKEKLEHVARETGEHILHVAMKDPEIFRLAIQAAAQCGILTKLLIKPDNDDDTVLQQLVQFGRPEAFQALIDLAKNDQSVCDALQEGMAYKNQLGLTPEEVAKELEDDNSPTVQALLNRTAVESMSTKKAEIAYAQKRLPEIKDQLETLPGLFAGSSASPPSPGRK